jgi:RNA polymerase sigma factor (sigma-70 family)
MAGLEDDGDSDAALIRLSWKEPERFTAIFERHAPAVHGYLCARAGRGVAEDLVSDTFITAFRGRARYDLTRPDARPWLFGIATHVAQHHRRAEGRRAARQERVGAGPDHHDDPADDVIAALRRADVTARVGAALARLDDRYRDVLMLVAGPGLSYDEVAQALDIPVGTVRSRLARGRAQLRELLDADGQHRRDHATPFPVTTPRGRKP